MSESEGEMKNTEKQVSVLLQNSAEGFTYSWSGKASSYDDAVDQARVAAVADDILTELDDVLFVAEGENEYILPGTVFGPPESDVIYLFQEGLNISCTDEFTSCPDILAVIDMAQVRKASRVLHQHKGLLSSVNIPADVMLGGDDFICDNCFIELINTNKIGAPSFGMFHLVQKYSDVSFGKGLCFEQPDYGDWKRAWIEGGKAYIADSADNRVEILAGKIGTDNDPGAHGAKAAKKRAPRA